MIGNAAFTKKGVQASALWIAGISFSFSYLWPFKSLLWNPFYQELLAFVGLAVLAFWIAGKRLLLSCSAIVVLAISILPLFQFQLGIIFYAGDAMLHACYMAAFFMAIVVGFNAAGTPEQGRQLIQCITSTLLIVAFVSSVIAIRQWLGKADSIWEIQYSGGRPYANLAQPNHLATLLCLGLVSLIYLYEKRLLNRVFSSAFAVFLIFALALTQSRTAWVIGILMVVFWLWLERGHRFQVTSRLLVAWLLIFFAAVLWVPILAEAMHLSSQSLESRIQASYRLDIWKASIQYILYRPYLGYGWGQTPIAQVSLIEQYPLGGILTYSHNLFLDLLLWNGVVIGGLIVLFVVVWQFRLIRALVGLENGVALLMVGVIFTHSMFEYSHAYAYFLLPAGLMLGVAERARVAPLSRTIPAWLWRFFGVCALLIMVLVIREYDHYEQNRFNQSISNAGVIGFEQQDLAGAVLLTQLEALQNLRRGEVTYELSDEVVKSAGKVVARYPYLSNIYKHSLMLMVQGRFEEACRQLYLLRVMHGDANYERALEQVNKDLKKIQMESRSGHLNPAFAGSVSCRNHP